jgi:SAM-dependent methyltransferase
MQEILPLLEEKLQNEKSLSFDVLDPDLCKGVYAGEKREIDAEVYCCRSLRTWMELAELLGCVMHVPQRSHAPLVRLTFEKIIDDSFHTDDITQLDEKYGSNSRFARIHKMEEAAFYYYYRQALWHALLEKRHSILDLGINRGDEFNVIRHLLPPETFDRMKLVGIDHSLSVTERAKSLFPEKNVTFIKHDINTLDTLELGRFDLLISIGTLQSPGISFKPLLMHLVQHYLNSDSALILGFPNARWRGGEMVYGAKAAHYNFSEMGVVLEDLLFAKRYLQQKKYRVMITGKQYLFLTAVRIGL